MLTLNRKDYTEEFRDNVRYERGGLWWIRLFAIHWLLGVVFCFAIWANYMRLRWIRQHEAWLVRAREVFETFEGRHWLVCEKGMSVELSAVLAGI